jgi:hypothetical protein
MTVGYSENGAKNFALGAVLKARGKCTVDSSCSQTPPSDGYTVRRLSPQDKTLRPVDAGLRVTIGRLSNSEQK